VAGGAGFLGTHLCQTLLARGDEVVSIDNFCTGSAANLAALTDQPGFTFLRRDITEPFDVAGPVDAVMNLASPASPKDFATIPVEILLAGSAGTKRLLDLAMAKEARFFQASTSEVYGEPAVHPQPETYWGNVNPIGPRSVYDEAKRYGEALTMAYHRSFGVDVRIARIFNTYGPYMRPDDGRVVSNFVCQALERQPLTVYGDGTQSRSFTFATDEIGGFLALLDSDYVGPVNIGNPVEFTMLELAHLVLAVTGSSSELIFDPRPIDDPTQRQPDISLARRILGWEPKVALAEGLESTVAWFSERLRTPA
jgi:nucleoside-diphosphate-sugar epimerase